MANTAHNASMDGALRLSVCNRSNASKGLIGMTTRQWMMALWTVTLLLPWALPLQASEPYRLGAGDRVRITVYGEQEQGTVVEVAADGTVVVPLLGQVDIHGLTPPAAGKLIAKRLENGGYLKSAQVNLLIEEYRSQTTAVLGHVSRPGRLALEGSTTLTEALAMVGGVSPEGGERVVLTRDAGDGRQRRLEFNLDRMLDSDAGNQSPVTMRKGDTLYVPRAETFYVYGQVKKPGTYPLHGRLNVMQALSVGGGLSSRASSDGLVVYRQESNGATTTLEVELTDPLQDGDVLFVKESLF